MKNVYLSQAELKHRGAIELGSFMVLEVGEHIEFYKKEGGFYVFADRYNVSHHTAIPETQELNAQALEFSNVQGLNNARKNMPRRNIEWQMEE